MTESKHSSKIFREKNDEKLMYEKHGWQHFLDFD